MTRRENALAYIRRQPCDYKPAPEELELFVGSDLVTVIDCPVCERPMVGSGYDVFGVHWSATDGVSHYTHGQEPRYDDIEDWKEQLRFPDINRLDWSEMAADAAKVDRENHIISVVLLTGPFERATELTSFEDCLCNLIMDPEDFSDLIGAIADYKIEVIRKCVEAAHPDVILFHDDWGTAKSPFMNPDLWREVIKPHIKRIYDAAHELGVLIVQHSCGNITPMVPDMVEMGADGWDGQPECNDFPTLMAEFGDRLYFLEKPTAHDDATDMEAPPPPPAGKYPPYDEIPEFLFK